MLAGTPSGQMPWGRAVSRLRSRGLEHQAPGLKISGPRAHLPRDLEPRSPARDTPGLRLAPSLGVNPAPGDLDESRPRGSLRGAPQGAQVPRGARGCRHARRCWLVPLTPQRPGWSGSHS